MEYRVFGTRIIARLDKGEEVVSSIRKICEETGVRLGVVTGIGALNYADLGIFLQTTRAYRSEKYNEDMEIVSLSGTVSELHGAIYSHLHIVLTRADFAAFGGHLNEARVGATCELTIDAVEGQVERKYCEEIGLNLISFKS